MSERSTHFAGFAKLLVPELDRLYMTLHARISELRPIEEIDKIEDEIRTLIAQRAYDLVAHAMTDLIDKHDGNIELFDVAGQGADFAACVPDLTAWPAHKESPHERLV